MTVKSKTREKWRCAGLLSLEEGDNKEVTTVNDSAE
jgi:hypothetical protein